MKIRVVIALNSAWNILNFRSGLIKSLIANGYEVIAVSPEDEYASSLEKLGCKFTPISMDNKGTNPLSDLLLLFSYIRVLRREKADVFLGCTIKPNIYGSLAAHLLGIPVVNNVTGLGATFIKVTWLTHVVKFLYRLALSKSKKVFFQNGDDRVYFINAGLVSEGATDRLPGSGIDLNKFVPVATGAVVPTREKGIRFLLVARMLWDKGVGEYVGAARKVKQRFPDAEFCLLGFLDVQNPAAISREQMQLWVSEGVVTYCGVTGDIRPYISNSDCVVLPSYREGTPRSLLEAAAMAKPIITTDAVGCREVVTNGVNGLLCKVRDVEDLAEKLMEFIALPSADRHLMGVNGRRKVENEFDENIVFNKYLTAIGEIKESLK